MIKTSAVRCPPLLPSSNVWLTKELCYHLLTLLFLVPRSKAADTIVISMGGKQKPARFAFRFHKGVVPCTSTLRDTEACLKTAFRTNSSSFRSAISFHSPRASRVKGGEAAVRSNLIVTRARLVIVNFNKSTQDNSNDPNQLQLSSTSSPSFKQFIAHLIHLQI